MNRQNTRRALGRGLSNLIPTDTPEEGSNNDVVFVDVNSVTSNPFQPRVDFDEKEIEGLSRSIESQGLLQPITLRKKVNGGYEIVSGERRFRALKKLGWDRIPAIVRPRVSDREMVELALVENIQRENLNDVETAKAYQRLLLECGLSHEQLSARVGKSRSAITNALRLLKLPEDIQKMLRDGALSMGHARALLALDNAREQKALAGQIAENDLSVRQVEDLIRKDSGGTKRRAKRRRGSGETPELSSDPDIAEYMQKIQYNLGTVVRIRASKGGAGKIEIQFHGTDDLTRILDLMGS